MAGLMGIVKVHLYKRTYLPKNNGQYGETKD
jgi:hypothetical protein